MKPFLSVLLLVLAGCAESVDPFVGADHPFTLWGFLDAGADTQRVRVISIEGRVGLDRTGPLDAEVTSTDLETGVQHTWRDSVVSYYDGSQGHVFWAPFRPRHDGRYRLEVARRDGATSRVDVTVPPPLDARVEPMAGGTTFRVTIESAAPHLIGARMIYWSVPAYPLQPYPIGTARPPGFTLPVAVSYEGRPQQNGTTWEVWVDMVRDFEAVRSEFTRTCLPEAIVLQRMEFRVMAADSSWMPPEGRFDPDALAQPGTFSNVENGYGFFGAGEVLRLRWVPTPAAQQVSGYALGAPCPMVPAPGCEIVHQPCFRCDEALPDAIRRAYCPVKGGTPKS